MSAEFGEACRTALPKLVGSRAKPGSGLGAAFQRPLEAHPQRQTVRPRRPEIGVVRPGLQRRIEYDLVVVAVEEILPPSLEHPALALTAKSDTRVHERVPALVLGGI